MMQRKIFKILISLALLFGIALIITSLNHPIILKWLTGSARIVGKPISATVYTNGQVNNNIKVFHVDKYWNGEKANYYLVNFKYADTKDTREFISLNLQDNYVGRPSSTDKNDYDIIFGLLFQSEVGSKFSAFSNDVKGYGFNPDFKFNDKQLQFNLPPKINEFNCDSMRIEL